MSLLLDIILNPPVVSYLPVELADPRSHLIIATTDLDDHFSNSLYCRSRVFAGALTKHSACRGILGKEVRVSYQKRSEKCITPSSSHRVACVQRLNPFCQVKKIQVGGSHASLLGFRHHTRAGSQIIEPCATDMSLDLPPLVRPSILLLEYLIFLRVAQLNPNSQVRVTRS